MGIQVTINYFDTEGDQAHQRHSTVVQRRDYDIFLEFKLPLSAGIKTDVPLPTNFTVEHLYVESPGTKVQVFKNLSPEYWEVDRIFQVFDCSCQQLALQAEADVDVSLRIGGSQ